MMMIIMMMIIMIIMMIIMVMSSSAVSWWWWWLVQQWRFWVVGTKMVSKIGSDHRHHHLLKHWHCHLRYDDQRICAYHCDDYRICDLIIDIVMMIEGRGGPLQILFPLQSCSNQLTSPPSLLFEIEGSPPSSSPPSPSPPPPSPPSTSPPSWSRRWHLQVWDRTRRVHEAASFKSPQIQLLPLYDPALWPNWPTGQPHHHDIALSDQNQNPHCVGLSRNWNNQFFVGRLK